MEIVSQYLLTYSVGMFPERKGDVVPGVVEGVLTFRELEQAKEGIQKQLKTDALVIFTNIYKFEVVDMQAAEKYGNVFIEMEE